MQIKGCVFELSYEFDLYRDLIREVLIGEYKGVLLNKITSELLGAHIEYVLNKRLNDYYRSPMDIISIAIDVLDVGFNGQFETKKIYELEDSFTEITQVLDNRLFDMFKGIDVGFALWKTSKITSIVYCVDYLGDYRIMEWHERSGIPYQGSTTDVSYEFSLCSLYTTISNILNPHFGRYAGRQANNYVDMVIRNIIEESIFLDSNKVITAEKTLVLHDVDPEFTTMDFPYTRERLREIFATARHDDIQKVLTEGMIIIENELKNVINATIDLKDVRNYFISDKVLTINVERPLTKVDFGDRLKVDIKTSIENGDWVPPKLRKLVDL